MSAVERFLDINGVRFRENITKIAETIWGDFESIALSESFRGGRIYSFREFNGEYTESVLKNLQKRGGNKMLIEYVKQPTPRYAYPVSLDGRQPTSKNENFDGFHCVMFSYHA